MDIYQQPIFILTGMHRSGTSLLSSLLQSTGVNIGKKLIPADDGNPKGYFENSDFVAFHENVLFSLGIDKIGWTTMENCYPPSHYIDNGKKLIELNQDQNNPWGWKEPRTTLFLDFWSDLLPYAYFIFVYRSPWEVLDSLYRRGDDIFHYNPELALQAWSNYNRQILRFYQKYPEKCLLFNLEKITVNPNNLIEMINGKFNLSLPSVDSSIYDASSLKTDAKKSQRPHLLKLYFPQIWEQYQELNRITDFQDSWEEVLENLPDNAWVLQDWLNVRILEKTLKNEKNSSSDHIKSIYQKLGETVGEKEAFEFQLGESQQELENTRQELDNTQSQLQQSQQELDNTRQELYNTQSQLQQSQQDLDNTRQELYNTQSQLQQSQQDLDNTRQELYNTQSQLQQSQQDLDNTKFQCQESQRELQDKKYELQQQELGFKELHFYFEHSQQELKQTQEKMTEIRENLHKKQEELQNSQDKIMFMENSKFWKLRNKWFRLKGQNVE